MYKLAVFGNPISHSLSPIIFELFAQQFNIDLEYTKILAVDEADFKYKLTNFFAQDGLAINVTSPFKSLAYYSVSAHTSRAKFCQAANFIHKNSDNDLFADTTDGLGLIKDIKFNKHYSCQQKNILIIGSGSVIDSILLDLIIENPKRIDILNRNYERLDALGAKFGVGKFNPNVSYDIILNSTPNIVENKLFAQIKQLKDDALCYDLIYGAHSLFLEYMKTLNQDINFYNGLGMLVEQAQIAFNKLFNFFPDTNLVLRQLHKKGYSCV